ncbi:predicted protein [Sparassis crispa]|uniref:ATP-dependent DNA ligase family profile domain-containing protein n=1 Tax=Sparassis crispa TaxID=139825 RepID=A0A401GVW9_9APHY|nr:predicted protein [Sparassis crispa]GBE86340.1 predicted protein [Sparassis crispa]
MTDVNSPTVPVNSIPFAFFVSLVEAIGAIKPRKTSSTAPHSSDTTSPAFRTFQNWVAELRRRYAPLPYGTTAVVFRLLFPEEDVRRKYGMQETRLGLHLSNVLALSNITHGRGRRLMHWNSQGALGCLGVEVRDIMSESSAVTESSISITEVDALLTELATTCAFSASTVRQSSTSSPPGSRESILRALYTAVTPGEASVLTQIILKDLRPLLYPIPEDAGHYTAALLHYNSNSITQLTKWDGMHEAALVYERREDGGDPPKPQPGIQVQIPKCVKGQGCAQALQLFNGSEKIWVETKYDGERAQIHVELASELGSQPTITIFSKSGRDSTLDRFAIHSVISEALDLGNRNSTTPQGITNSVAGKINKNVILEAEMVAFSDTLNKIDEFWRIRSLVASTALGVRHTGATKAHVGEDEILDSQCSMISNASDGGTRHLALVFFDVLLLDDTSLLSASYSTRRAILESVVTEIPGYSMLAQRTHIDPLTQDADALLRTVFSKLIADHQEGIVLKADEGRYNERRFPWVKLKKDYIPGYGDTLDLVLVGAAWEKDRARVLSVPPTVYTTFYLGALSNGDIIKGDLAVPPHFEVFFTVCYGLTREKLEELNFIIKSADPVPYSSRNPMTGLSYKCNLFPGLPPSAVLLRQPVLAEVFGAGFTKAPQNKFYELRFPRISKVFRPSERSWTEGTTLEEFQSIARESVGRDRPNKDVDDWCNELWGKPRSPGVDCPRKRKNTEAAWESKLALVDQKQNHKRARKIEIHSRARADDSLPHRPRRVRETENVGSPAAGPSGCSPTLRAFGSVTNIARDPVTQILLAPSPANVQDEEPSADRRPSTSSVAVNSPGALECPPATPILGHAAPPNSCMDHPRLWHCAALSSTDASVFGCKQGNRGFSTQLSALLENAVIWLAKPSNSSRPSQRAPSRLALPEGQLVHGLESFLQACGWNTADNNTCNWAERGIVFVEEGIIETRAEDWMEYPLKTLLSRRALLVSLGMAARCKPVWVFGVGVLDSHKLRNQDQEGDLENRALCKLG